MGRYLCGALSPWPSTCTDEQPLEIHTYPGEYYDPLLVKKVAERDFCPR